MLRVRSSAHRGFERRWRAPRCSAPCCSPSAAATPCALTWRTGRAGAWLEERKSFYLWGLAPTRRVDVHEKCPYGVAQITEETTFGDGVFNLITLGIWAPRSTYYVCRPAPAEG